MMPRYLFRYRQDDPRYFMWSTVVDAPVSSLMTADEYREYHWHAFGHQDDGTQNGPDARLARADEFGTSDMSGHRFGGWGSTIVFNDSYGFRTGARDDIRFDENDPDVVYFDGEPVIYE